MKDDRSPRKILSLAANPASQRDPGQERVARDFEQAHRAAFIQDALALVRYEPVDLLPFELVRERLHLSNKYYLGLQEIPLEQIVGSVGRYEDFTRTFMPRKTNSRQRWEKIDSLTDSGGWPPIASAASAVSSFSSSAAASAGWRSNRERLSVTAMSSVCGSVMSVLVRSFRLLRRLHRR